MTRAHYQAVCARRRRTALGVLVAVTLCWGVVLAAPAQAHAGLVETMPRDGEVVSDAPERVVLRFNEPVEVPHAGIRVHDAEAQQLAQGAGTRSDDGTAVTLDLPADLPDAGYVVTWRVVSDDGHLVAGAFTFTVGEGVPVADAVVAELFGGGEDRVLGAVGSILRGIGYAGVLTAAGAVAFTFAVAASPDDRARARRLAIPAVGVGTGATVLALPVQAMTVGGTGLVDAMRPGGALGAVVTSSFGQSTAVRLVGLAVLAAGWRRTDGQPRWLVVPAAVAAASFTLDGHQRTVDPTWLVAGADVAHLLAASVWFGSLVVLALVLRQRVLDDDPVGGARLVRRFSRLALWSVLVVATAGVAMAWALVRVPRGLVETGYGRLLTAKLALVALVVVAATYNNRRLVPAVAARLAARGEPVRDNPPSAAPFDSGGLAPPSARGEPVRDNPPSGIASLERRSQAAWRQLRTTVRVEVAGILAVLAVTGFLVVERPAADELGVSGAYQTTVAFTDDLDLDVVVDPNRVGRNAIHVYVLDATGRPAVGVEDLRLELTYQPEQIGPFTVQPFVAGPGHWVAYVDDLRFAGEWRIRVVAAVDRFEEAGAELVVEVHR